jgi:glutamate carboxypeptidase
MVDAKIRQKLLDFVEDQASEQLQFVIDLSHQNSYSWHKAGTDRVAEMIMEKVAGAFPHHRVVEQAQVGNLHLLTNAPDEKSIYVLAHMDTVFPPDHPFRECRVEGDRLHGPGTGDMKAGVATVVYAVLALKEAGLLDRIPLTVIFGGDEEIGAITSRTVYEEEREKALACLVVEGAGVEGEIVVSRNGKIGARLDCLGRDQHVGAAVLDKASAILELAHKTIALEALNGALPGVRVNVGKVEGGLGPATIPASASAQIDIRWEDQVTRNPLMAKIQDAVAREELPGCRSELTILNERSAWPHTEGSQHLADLVKKAGREIGQEIGQEHRRGTSDSNFFGCAGVPTVDGIGPICKGYHTAEEFVYIPSIKERTALLANALVKMTTGFSASAGPEGRP